MRLWKGLHLSDGAGGGSGEPDGANQAGKLELTDLDKQFLSSKGISVEALGSDPAEMLKAVNLLARESAAVVKKNAELEKQARLAARGAEVQPAQPLKADGTVDTNALKQLEQQAASAAGMKKVAGLLLEQGKIDEATFRLLTYDKPDAASDLMELIKIYAPANGKDEALSNLEKKVDDLLKQIGGTGLMADLNQGTPQSDTAGELAALRLPPDLPGKGTMEQLQEERRKQIEQARLNQPARI